MYIFLKYIVTLFYKKLRIKIVVCLLRESGPWRLDERRRSAQAAEKYGRKKLRET